MRGRSAWGEAFMTYDLGRVMSLMKLFFVVFGLWWSAGCSLS